MREGSAEEHRGFCRGTQRVLQKRCGFLQLLSSLCCRDKLSFSQNESKLINSGSELRKPTEDAVRRDEAVRCRSGPVGPFGSGPREAAALRPSGRTVVCSPTDSRSVIIICNNNQYAVKSPRILKHKCKCQLID